MLKMLIADDEQLIRESLAECIAWENYGITVAACCKNGLEALDCVVDLYPDIVLTDICMPGLNGLALIEKIQQADRDVQIIIISGYQEFEYAKQAMQYGVKHYLLKPINQQQLLDAVEDAKQTQIQNLKVKMLLQKNRAIENAPDGYENTSTAIVRMKKYVQDHLGDSNLTLKWLAENVMFMNVDYLSRKFLTETTERFSAYLNRLRMEKAKELLTLYGKDCIADIADKVGCSNNPRYFGQLFKKHTGMTPTQYCLTRSPKNS